MKGSARASGRRRTKLVTSRTLKDLPRCVCSLHCVTISLVRSLVAQLKRRVETKSEAPAIFQLRAIIGERFRTISLKARDDKVRARSSPTRAKTSARRDTVVRTRSTQRCRVISRNACARKETTLSRLIQFRPRK